MTETPRPQTENWATTPRLCHCGQPVRKTVVYINRRNGKENRRTEMCDVHVQQELVLATSGLSMVDIDIRPLADA